jgi:hypothetical protein
LTGERIWDTTVLTCAESSRNGIDSGWGETPFLFENKPSRRASLVPVMESSDFKNFDYGTKRWRLNGSRYRRVFAERQVSARAQVICEIEIQKAPQRRLVEHYHVVQALASNRADEALSVRILPRRLGRGEHFAHAHPPDSGPERLPINRIAIPQQIRGHITPRKRLDHLLCRPFRAGVGGDVEMEESPPLVRQHHEDIENSKGDGRHHEEVRRDQLLRVGIEESAPRLGRRFSLTSHALGHGGLGYFDTELEQFPMNPRRSR